MANQKFAVGDTMRIQWQTNGNAITGAVIRFSNDGGLDWTILTSQGVIQRSDTDWGDFKWIIPQNIYIPALQMTIPTQSDSCLLEVVDYNDMSVSDGTKKCFSIAESGM